MGAVSRFRSRTRRSWQEGRGAHRAPDRRRVAAGRDRLQGFLFIGLMNVARATRTWIEYNVRMGDPETEVVLPRITSDLIAMFEGIAYGRLDRYALEVSPQTAVTVICVSGGYPGDYAKGMEISGLDTPTQSIVFHAGTTAKGDRTYTAGGRVLAVTSLGGSIAEALHASYDTIGGIAYEGKNFRRDIGQDLIGLREIGATASPGYMPPGTSALYERVPGLCLR
ncbi:MAG: phosphoribosylglycinamide synthetase C domain-containing protein [Alistipes indistinctus]